MGELWCQDVRQGYDLKAAFFPTNECNETGKRKVLRSPRVCHKVHKVKI